LRRNITTLLVFCFVYSLALKMETVSSCETSDVFRTTRRFDSPEGRTVHGHSCENLKCYIPVIFGGRLQAIKLSRSYISLSSSLSSSLDPTILFSRAVPNGLCPRSTQKIRDKILYYSLYNYMYLIRSLARVAPFSEP
jgi:hypothetical protein